MSLLGNPASRKRCAIASAAAVTLPTESVVLISINCLKMSSANRRVASSAGEGCCASTETVNTRQKKTSQHVRDPTFILQKSLANSALESSAEFRKEFRTMLRLKANRFVRQNQV